MLAQRWYSAVVAYDGAVACNPIRLPPITPAALPTSTPATRPMPSNLAQATTWATDTAPSL